LKNKQLRILIAPLDWGMGHTTRCVPLIKHIAIKGNIPVFAGNENQIQYIKSLFKEIECVRLDGYNITYAQSKKWFTIKIIQQIPKILKAIQLENNWLKRVVITHKIDGIISDNRYGMYHKSVPCVILTHQLSIQTNINRYSDLVIQKLLYKLINKFNACWVVDTKDENQLAGILSHPKVRPNVPLIYIGWLSQFEYENNPEQYEKDCILILLSGVEPQRSILHKRLWEKAIQADVAIIFVAGSNHTNHPKEVPEHIEYQSLLQTAALKEAIQASRLVICRSGYSSIMDLVALGKKAVLVPTPGQSEQEYLSKYLLKHKLFQSTTQNKVDIETIMINVSLFKSEFKRSNQFTLFKNTLEDWLNKIQST
jgi:uncharacterized protein (TIGR00661 family)